MIWAAGIASIAVIPWLVELGFFRKNLLILAWWILIPLAVPIMIGGSKFAPSELVLLFLMTTPLWASRSMEFKKTLKHPITILLGIEIAIYFLSTLTSTMPMVSVKRLIIHTLYISGGYILFTGLFSKSEHIIKMPLMMALGLVPVFILGVLFAARYNFMTAVIPAAPRPFFKDHTEFGAFAAFILPLLAVLYLHRRSIRIRFTRFQLLLTLTVLLSVAFSFSRAVWLSIASVAILYLLIRIGFRYRHLLVIGIIAGVGFFQYSNQVYQVILQNESESDREEIIEQIKSVGNVRSDVSNLERINRWKSAVKMFREKPILGFGPGTYQFQYAPYQELQDKTVISTNFGDAGNAHSEYLMYLAETGIIGFVMFFILCNYIIWLGIRLYRTSQNSVRRYLALGLTLGLFGFLVHSVFNSFLETDKIGLVFYLFLGALVALDIKERSYNSR